MILLKPVLYKFSAKNARNAAPEDLIMHKAFLMMDNFLSQLPN